MSKMDNISICKKRIIICLIGFFVTAIAMIIIYYRGDVVPFGGISLTYNDADIQYIDMLSYYIGVLKGENSISYSMSNMLGTGCLPLYSYYLASPFNLLLIFFTQDSLNLFFSVVILLKLATASGTCAYYLQVRFQDKVSPLICTLLSVGYALMQYNIAQSSNIMWLDGVYLLPLIMLGVYKVVENKKNVYLAIIVGVSIFINWYIAGVNCLFSIIFFVVELILANKKGIKEHFEALIIYGGSMLMGVMLSGVVFLPTIIAMRGGKGDFDWEALESNFNDNIITLIRDYTIGGTSEDNSVSLFCGSLAIIGCGMLFVSKEIKLKEKLTLGALLTFMLLTFFYKPLILLFSLLKVSNGHWCRYSFLAVFVIMFLAGYYYGNTTQKVNIIGTTIKMVIVYMIVSYIAPKYDINQVYMTAISVIITSIVLYFVCNTERKIVCSVLLIVVSLTELVSSANLVIKIYSQDSLEYYFNYTKGQRNHIESISEMDNGYYRIAQTEHRGNKAHLNESMGYGYWSNTGYTSSAENSQLIFLDQLGYRLEANCIINTETSIIPADSLLGVKYVLTGYKINGLELDEGISNNFNKRVYKNPYALPMGFTYKPMNQVNYVDQFDYHSQIYSELYGEKVNLYIPLEYTYIDEGNKRTYTLDVPAGDYAVYGNLPWNKEMNATINSNNVIYFGYSRWMSQTLFYVPTSEGDTFATVTVDAKNGLAITDSQFYALDLNLFAEITKKISAREVSNIIIKDGYIKCEVDGREGDSLFLSVPYSEGWHIKINGKKVEANMFADCLMSIPIYEGRNSIEMKYYPPGILMGSIITLLGLLSLILCVYVQKHWDSSLMIKIKSMVNSSGFRYLFIGGCTTLVNLISYAILCKFTSLNITVSNIISIALAIIFAYVTNKLVVFKSHRTNIKELIREFLTFIGARLFTMAVEVFGVLFLFEILGQGEFVAKLEVQIIVLIGNYFISKLLVFKNTKVEGK